jgi:hypothetical protein
MGLGYVLPYATVGFKYRAESKETPVIIISFRGFVITSFD